MKARKAFARLILILLCVYALTWAAAQGFNLSTGT